MINGLMELGFSEYEARAYIQLTKAHPLTAYQTAKRSGIPSSKIYEVLAKLGERNAVMEITENGKRLFVPQHHRELLQRMRSRLDDTFDELERGLAQVDSGAGASYVWNISGYAELTELLQRKVRGAESAVLVSAWDPELKELSQVLAERESAGVRVAVIHFGPTSVRVGSMYRHPIADTLYEEKGGRGLVTVIDSSFAVMATIGPSTASGIPSGIPSGDVEGAWSENHGFVALAEDYVKHDIYVMKIVERFDDELVRRFGCNYHHLRDVYSDEEEGR